MPDDSVNPPKTAQTALVTGSGKRLGRAIALGLAEDGFDLALHYNRSRDETGSLQQEIKAMGRRAITIAGNLEDPKNASLIVKAASDELGPLSLLVNNASLFEKDSLSTMSLSSWRRLTDVNLTSPVLFMQAFAAQPALPDGASIINMLDQQMSAPSPDFFSYAVSKIGLEGATRLAAFELAPKLRVNGIAPGLVLRSGAQTEATFLKRQRMMPLGEGLSESDIIRALRYLITSPHVTGEVMLVDSGQNLIGPGNSPFAPMKSD